MLLEWDDGMRLWLMKWSQIWTLLLRVYFQDKLSSEAPTILSSQSAGKRETCYLAGRVTHEVCFFLQHVPWLLMLSPSSKL
ncbi:uncharacterized protein G2W53_003909 [Senna tora]|uniref:Uncharacterized protein n=1 Tax=Senna tora TaxID=362788 RepID=A0A834XBA3_9FABA|nr:uncharacterized protein G2W53_003909 [Senna tora]